MKDFQGQFLSTVPGGIVGGAMSSQTVRTDYILFSTYEVQFGKERFKAPWDLQGLYLFGKTRAKVSRGSFRLLVRLLFVLLMLFFGVLFLSFFLIFLALISHSVPLFPLFLVFLR
jgi:hypothetical protein